MHGNPESNKITQETHTAPGVCLLLPFFIPA